MNQKTNSHFQSTKGSDNVATFIYIVLTLLGTVSSIVIFNLAQLTWMHALLWILSLIVSMIIAFIIMLLFLVGYRFSMRKVAPKNMRHHKTINSIFRLAFRLMRVKMVVTGQNNIPRPGEKFVFVCNHQENYDIMAIKPLFKNHPLNFIAKQEVFDWPILGHMIEKLGNVPITREADRSAAESIVKGIRLVKDGIPMAIFPEGKRTFGNAMTDFKPGAFKLAMKPKATIIIGTIYNFNKIFKWWPFRSQKVFIHFHQPLLYEAYQPMNSIELSTHVKSIIQDKLDNYKMKLNV